MAIFFHSTSKRNVKRSQYQKGFAKISGGLDDSQEFVFDVTDDEIPTGDDLNIELNETRKSNGARSRFASESTGANKNNPSSRKESIAQYIIQAGDSLQSVALKFGCPVAELKRLNHFINDNEFYAVRKLKIPAKDHSILAEILYSSNQEVNDPSPESDTPSRKTFHVSISHMLQEEGCKESKSFLQEMDRDIQRIVDKTQSKQTALEEELNLTSPRFQPLYEKKTNFDGASWGISWCSLLIAIVILGVLAPTLYGIYIVTSLSRTNETNSESVPANLNFDS